MTSSQSTDDLVKRLRRDLCQTSVRYQAADTIERLQADLAAERERRERVEKDAERYRWLRGDYSWTIHDPLSVFQERDGYGVYQLRIGAELDAAIDAARSEGGKP